MSSTPPAPRCDDILLDQLEHIRNGANTHQVANLSATYRSFYALLNELRRTHQHPDLIMQVVADSQEVERHIRAFVYAEQRKYWSKSQRPV